MRIGFYTAVVGVLVVGGGGCVVPVPHTRAHEYGVTGQVTGAIDCKPVGGASVVSIDEPTETALCDGDGNFRLRPRRGWHAAYLIGPDSLSVLPAWDITAPVRQVRISAPGYMTADFSVGTFPDGSSHHAVAEVAGAYLRAGRLELVPAGDDSRGGSKAIQRTEANR